MYKIGICSIPPWTKNGTHSLSQIKQFVKGACTPYPPIAQFSLIKPFSCYSFRMKKTKKSARSTPAKRWILNERTAPPVVAFGAMIGVILLTLLFHTVVQPKTANKKGGDTATTAVSFTGTDGVVIAADLEYPSGAGPFPVVILLHEFGQDRSQWKQYRDFFMADGFAVMRYDIRGFGESTIPSIPSAQATWFASMPTDLVAAVRFLKEQQRFFAEKIYVIGVGLGANIAYIGSGTIPGIDKTVLLSPSVLPQLDGSAVDNFFPKNILALANIDEQPVVEAMLSRVTNEKNSEFISDPGIRGLALVQRPELQARIRNWLRQ